MNQDLWFLFGSILLGASGQVLLKFAVSGLGEVSFSRPEMFHTLLRIFTNGWILLGILFFVSSMLLWIWVISRMDLSKAYPSVSLSYIIVFLLSVILFKEQVSLWKIAGLVLVSTGVFFLQR